MKKADIDSTVDTLEGEKPTGGGLYIPGKERMLFRSRERSRLGLDTLALAKRAESKANGALKAPREGLTSVAASLDDEEKSTVTGADEDGLNDHRERPIRRYRESVASEASESESYVTREGEVTDNHRSRESVRSEYSRVDRVDSRSEREKGSHRYNDDDSKDWSRGADHGRYDRRHSGERYERGSSGGRYERGSSSARYERDSAVNMEGNEVGMKDLRGPLGDQTGMTEHGNGRILHTEMVTVVLTSAISHHHPQCWSERPLMLDWCLRGRLHDLVHMLPHGIVRPHHLFLFVLLAPRFDLQPPKYGGRQYQNRQSTDVSQNLRDMDGDNSSMPVEQNFEITDSMRLEMEYNSDRSWFLDSLMALTVAFLYCPTWSDLFKRHLRG